MHPWKTTPRPQDAEKDEMLSIKTRSKGKDEMLSIKTCSKGKDLTKLRT